MSGDIKSETSGCGAGLRCGKDQTPVRALSPWRVGGTRTPFGLLVFVDDATSRIMELRFVISESTFDYVERADQTLQDRLVKELRLRGIVFRAGDGQHDVTPTFLLGRIRPDICTLV